MHRTSAKPKTCSTWSCSDALRYRSKARHPSTDGMRARSSAQSIGCAVNRCLQSGAVLRVVSCTPQTLPFAMPSVQQQRTLFTAAPTGQQGQSGSRRQRRCRDHPPVCAARGPLHARRASAMHGHDAKRTPYRGRGDGPSAALNQHCLVHLREPARRRCIQLRREYLEQQLVGQRE